MASDDASRPLSNPPTWMILERCLAVCALDLVSSCGALEPQDLIRVDCGRLAVDDIFVVRHFQGSMERCKFVLQCRVSEEGRLIKSEAL